MIHPSVERVWHLVRLNTYNGLTAFDDSWPDASISCSGHFSYNPTPFKNIFDKNDVVYTNSDLYDLLNPTKDSFPYIYDNFRWSHCDYLGKLLFESSLILSGCYFF